MRSGEQPSAELPAHDDPIDGYHYCPCGRGSIQGVGHMPTRDARCATCFEPTAAVPTSPEVRRHAAQQERA